MGFAPQKTHSKTVIEATKTYFSESMLRSTDRLSCQPKQSPLHPNALAVPFTILQLYHNWFCEGMVFGFEAVIPESRL
jgi:hypothetical protein